MAVFGVLRETQWDGSIHPMSTKVMKRWAGIPRTGGSPNSTCPQRRVYFRHESKLHTDEQYRYPPYVYPGLDVCQYHILRRASRVWC